MLNHALKSPIQDLFIEPETRKAQLGQFMTPPAIADFMAQLFPRPTQEDVRLLDAGAGQGE
jgi:adenine-specific DNA-methyltransferase